VGNRLASSGKSLHEACSALRGRRCGKRGRQQAQLDEVEAESPIGIWACLEVGPGDRGEGKTRRFQVVVLFAHDAWIFLISMAGVTVLPPYLASTLYLVIFSRDPNFKEHGSETRGFSLLTGILASIYSAWLLYAAGWQYLFMSTILFALGLPVYWYARRERMPNKPAFTTGEKVGACALVMAAVLAVVLFLNGTVSFG